MRSLCFGSALLMLSCGASNGSTKMDMPTGSGGDGAMSAGGANSAAGNSSAGSGGSGGVAVVHPPPVGKCDVLGAVGAWQNIMPPYLIDHPTYTGALVPLVNPLNPAVVYVTTDGAGVFRSTDCGSTWTKANTGKNADKLDSGRIWAAVIDPVESETLYALTGYGAGGLWKTVNGGTDWDQLMPDGSDIATAAGGFAERVVMDPTNRLHLLINFHLNCSAPHTPVCFGESKDGGQTWSVLDFPTTFSTSWGEGSGLMMIDSKTWLYQEYKLFYTADAGKNWKEVTPDGGLGSCFPGDSRITKLPDGSLYLGAQSGVLQSKDSGATWTVIQNSGHALCPVIGDGQRLFAATLSNPQVIYAAPYSDPTNWTQIDSPGLPMSPAENMYVLAYDPEHHLLYGTAQSAGIFRVVTQ